MMDIVPQYVVQCSFDFALPSTELPAGAPLAIPPCEKCCSKCKMFKSIDQFGKDRDSSDGYTYSCKSCLKDDRRERAVLREEERKKGLVEVPSEKRCTKCHRLLPLECFKLKKDNVDGREASCRDCRNARSRASRKEIRRAAENRSEKRCEGCRRFLPFDHFDVSKRARQRRSSYCKECAEALAQSIEQGSSFGQKQCAMCKRVLPLCEFDRHYKGKDGLYGSCRACRAASALSNRGASKPCSTCGHRLPVSEFGPNKGTKDGLCGECRACRRSRERSRSPQRNLRREYGLTLQEYSEMLAQQGGVCAVCKMPETSYWKGKPRPLSVDHDHETGMVRALLCIKCNTALGSLEEDAERIQTLLEYAHWCQSLKAPNEL